MESGEKDRGGRGGGGRRGSYLQLMTTRRAKTRLKEEDWTKVSQSRSGGATPALPLPELLPPSFPRSALSRKKWRGNAGRASPSVLLSPRHLILSRFPSLLSPHYEFLYLLLFAFFPTPLSPPSPCLTLLNQQHVGLMETRPLPIPLQPAGFSIVRLISFDCI